MREISQIQRPKQLQRAEESALMSMYADIREDIKNSRDKDAKFPTMTMPHSPKSLFGDKGTRTL